MKVEYQTFASCSHHKNLVETHIPLNQNHNTVWLSCWAQTPTQSPCCQGLESIPASRLPSSKMVACPLPAQHRISQGRQVKTHGQGLSVTSVLPTPSPSYAALAIFAPVNRKVDGKQYCAFKKKSRIISHMRHG